MSGVSVNNTTLKRGGVMLAFFSGSKNVKNLPQPIRLECQSTQYFLPNIPHTDPRMVTVTIHTTDSLAKGSYLFYWQGVSFFHAGA